MTALLTVELDGAARLIDSLGQAVTYLEDGLDAVAADAADQILGVVRPPRKSGHLASTVNAVLTPNGVGLGASADYFGPIHWGWPARNITAQPFFVDAYRAKEQDVVDQYTDHLGQAVDKIKGA